MVLAGSLVLAAAGLRDDRGGLSPFVRLGLHVATAVALVAVVGGIDRLPFPPPLDIPLGALGGAIAVVWIVAVVNFYNFLDGIDGLAGLQAAVTGTGIALVAWESTSAALGACLAGAALGFLLHNWAPARIFLGDVGSHFLGFCFAAAPFLTPPASRPAAIGFVALSLFLFLADATWTLIGRVARGERFYEAHREHVYQQLVSGGWSHARMTSFLGGASLVLSGIGLVAWRTGSHAWMWTGFALGVAAFGAELCLARRARARCPAPSPSICLDDGQVAPLPAQPGQTMGERGGRALYR
jgi:glycosyltransferase WbpL